MLSFQNMYVLAQDLAQDTDSDSLTFFKTNINIGQHLLETELSSFFTEETATVTTVAGTSSYDTPARFIRLENAYVTVSSVRYVMDEVHDEDEWQVYQSNQSSTSRSDVAQKIIVRKDSFEMYPTPSSANTVTLRYEAVSADLQYADYTTGTITTLANGAAAVTGSGTTFTAAMTGRYFKIDADNVWYKIASFGTTTTITLDKNYEGTAISSGTETYTIGQMPITPESTHHIPVYYALMNYYQGFKQNEERGAYFRGLYEADMKRAKKTFSRRYSSKYLPPRSQRTKSLINPNAYPTGLT